MLLYWEIYVRLSITLVLMVFISFAAVLLSGNVCRGDGWIPDTSRRLAFGISKNFAPKSYQQPPDWARDGRKPLFRIAWLSDMHLDGTRASMIAAALAHVDARIKPDFVLITGDNNATPSSDAKKSTGRRRQEFLKTFMQKHLKTPYAIIPGDNWPQDFEKVFGSRQYSFDHGGVHFLMSSLDRGSGGKSEGLTVFDDKTWAWMKSDLEKNRDKPVVFALHEPVFPPTFLDAPRLWDLLKKYPNVVACFHGHIHADMEFQTRGEKGPGPKSILCPALGPGRPPAMKEVRVFRDIFVIRTIEAAVAGPEPLFRYADKWQRVDIPKSLRGCIAEPMDVKPFSKNYSARAPEAFVEDASLKARLPELFKMLQDFLRAQQKVVGDLSGNTN